MHKLEYLKRFQNALKTYNEENQTTDIDLAQKMYDYITNFDNLNENQKQKLNDFIEENTVSFKHLANLYLDENGILHLHKQLRRMKPFIITKPKSNMRVVKGNELLLNEAINKSVPVKVLCKTKNQQKAA